MAEEPDHAHGPPWRLHDLAHSDPAGELTDRSTLSDDAVGEIDDLMAALAELRRVEEELADASCRYMKLGRTDMRALHFLIASANSGEPSSAGALGRHLGISSGAITKLLDRLEKDGHILRGRHPSDRRAIALTVTPSTRDAAMRTMGLQHAERFHAAARLTSHERDVITGFLQDMARRMSPAGLEWAADTDEMDRSDAE